MATAVDAKSGGVSNSKSDTATLPPVAASKLKRGNVIEIKGRVCTIVDIKNNHLHTKYNITGVDSNSRKVNDVFTSTHAFMLVVSPPSK